MDRQGEWTLSDWERLGRAFAAGREDVGLTQVSAARALGVTRTPIQAIERGRQSNGQPFSKVTQTMRGYAQLVGWTADSPTLILNGQEPKPATQPGSASEIDARSDLPSAVDRELRSGKTLDHAVVHLGTNEDDDTRLIVVLQGAENMTEDEIDAAWQKWRQTRRRLQAIPGETDNPQES
ncbi:helix-turn-helix transcriptional regulator [Streptomyces sp. AC555_RSS877]|uniref:helix-turn-helix domain-containing protein n=1 Tax=Streptomyces sp. AC555_RSS877 TaxID=2823688 RepID=UPI001C25848B|nr:helix-turn-helix transcriptional regulator [Streptomyces sp. AC555_RSS877]